MMNGIQQAKAVKRQLARMIWSSPQYIYVRGHKKAEEYHGPTEAEAVICAEEVSAGLLERVVMFICEPGSWDYGNAECVFEFYGDEGRERKDWKPPYPRMNGVYCGLGTLRYTLYISRCDAEVDDVAEEEIDVDAEDEKEAREMGKVILESGEYVPGMKIVGVEGPRLGLYL